jgi:hypothetical protein
MPWIAKRVHACCGRHPDKNGRDWSVSGFTTPGRMQGCLLKLLGGTAESNSEGHKGKAKQLSVGQLMFPSYIFQVPLLSGILGM